MSFPSIRGKRTGPLFRVLPRENLSWTVRAVCAYWLMSSEGLSAAAQAHQASGTLHADMRQTRLRRVSTKTCYRIAFARIVPGPLARVSDRQSLLDITCYSPMHALSEVALREERCAASVRCGGFAPAPPGFIA